MGWAFHGASCPWDELPMGRDAHGASCHGVSCHRASFDGASFDGASFDLCVLIGQVVWESFYPTTQNVTQGLYNIIFLES
jgi:uncharacterized protein YjbI with pentapeptide repeats